MQDYIQIDVEINSEEQSDILVAELSEINFESFEEKTNLLSAFIMEENYNEELLKEILSNQNLFFTKSIIKPINWNQKWESEYPPVIVDDLVAVRAFFHQPITSVKHEILITPKMSFGTGHHATTFLMLQQMAKINFKNKSVLDFGTGTGVLAIYASKLGADKITAIDNDEWSIKNAKENIITNQCVIKLLKSDTPDVEGLVDTILANINLNVIKDNLINLKNICKPSSQLIFSGVLKSDQKNLIDELETQNINVVNIHENKGWICVLAK